MSCLLQELELSYRNYRNILLSTNHTCSDRYQELLLTKHSRLANDKHDIFRNTSFIQQPFNDHCYKVQDKRKACHITTGENSPWRHVQTVNHRKSSWNLKSKLVKYPSRKSSWKQSPHLSLWNEVCFHSLNPLYLALKLNYLPNKLSSGVHTWAHYRAAVQCK